MSLGLELAIESPENVVLTHPLAGPAPRCLAYLIDLLIRWGVLFVAAIVTIIIASALPGLAIGTYLLLLFLLEWGYTIGFEFGWQGQTPGKRVCGLRVIHENGQPLSWWGAALRNLLRVGDMLPFLLLYGEDIGALATLPVYGPGIVCMLLSPKLQRLGDLAARTVVVHERRTLLPRDPVIYDHMQPIPPTERNALVPRSETLALVDQFLGRRSVLSYQRGHELASRLARGLAEGLAYRGDLAAVEKYPMAFLARVYVTFAIVPLQETADVHDPPRHRDFAAEGTR